MESDFKLQTLVTYSKFVRFASIGICATAIQYALLLFLVELFDLRASIASTVGFVFSAAANYFLNRRFTFRSSARHTVAVPKFLIVALTGASANWGIVAWFELHPSVHYLVSQACATLIVLLWNFAASSIWTFR